MKTLFKVVKTIVNVVVIVLVLLFVLSFALLVGCSKPIFTVTFDSNGGSNVAAVEVAKKETATKKVVKTKKK